MHASRWNARAVVLSLAVAVAVSGCNRVEPLVIVDPSEVSEVGYTTPTTLPKSVAYAEEVWKRYRQRISDQMLAENAVGTGLIAAAATAFGLAAVGDAGDAIVWLGAGGAAAYTASQIYVSKLQQHIYAAGAGAISCSVAAMAPRRAAYVYLPELKRLVEGENDTAKGSLRENIDNLSALLMATPGETPLHANARAAIAIAEAAEGRGVEAISALESAGDELMAGIRTIESDVDRAIIDSRPELSSLLASLTQAIPTAAAQISPPPAAPAIAAMPADKAADLGLKEPTERLLNKARRVNVLADKVGAQPSAAALAKCKVDVEKEGLAFKLNPHGEIAVDATKDQVVTINASGGTPPYMASWSELTPSERITLSVDDSFRGIVTAKIQKGAPAGKFTVFVEDGSKGSGTVTLNVTGGSATGNLSTAPKPIDKTVENIQSALIDLGITSVEVDGVPKTLKADGLWGDITKAAITKYLKDNFPGETVPTTKERLIDAVKPKLGVT